MGDPYSYLIKTMLLSLFEMHFSCSEVCTHYKLEYERLSYRGEVMNGLHCQ